MIPLASQSPHHQSQDKDLKILLRSTHAERSSICKKLEIVATRLNKQIHHLQRRQTGFEHLGRFPEPSQFVTSLLHTYDFDRNNLLIPRTSNFSLYNHLITHELLRFSYMSIYIPTPSITSHLPTTSRQILGLSKPLTSNTRASPTSTTRCPQIQHSRHTCLVWKNINTRYGSW